MSAGVASGPWISGLQMSASLVTVGGAQGCIDASKCRQGQLTSKPKIDAYRRAGRVCTAMSPGGVFSIAQPLWLAHPQWLMVSNSHVAALLLACLLSVL